MAMLWQDGFDLYNNVNDLTMVYYSGSTAGFGVTDGRFGGGAWHTTSYGITKAVTPAAEIWTSFAVNSFSTGAGDQIVCTFNSAIAEEVTITYNPATSVWKAWRGYNAATLGNATSMLAINAWHWVDVRAKMSATVGEVEVWVDDVQVLTLTGQNTINNSGQTQISNVQLGDNRAGQALRVYIDDWFIYTPGARLGDSRIETLVPTSDASPNQATPSTGTNHYAVVDEAQFNTSDYLTMANTSGHKEVFGHGALANTPPTVHSVAIKMVSQKSDAGAFSLAPLVVSSGTEGDGGSQPVTTTWGLQVAMFEQDPHTSAAWTYGAVNSASIGYAVP